jgi:hypothetical protein
MCAAALLAVIPAATTLEVGLAGEASAGNEPVWHWNIYGTCAGAGNCGDYAPVDVLQWFYTAAASKPWVVTLNEVCDRQFADLYARFYPVGYQMIFAKTNGVPGTPTSSPVAGHPFGTVNCRTLNQISGQFGNAVMMLGSYSSRYDHYFVNQVPGDDVRAMSCMVVNLFGLRRGCVSHLDKEAAATFGAPGAYTIAQDNTTHWLFNYFSSVGERVTLGADRNTTIHGPWTAFNEIDTASPKLRTHSNASPNYKIDWVLGGPGHGQVAGTTRYCAPAAAKPISDHCMLMGNFFI